MADEDKSRLTNYSNFEVLMSMMREKNPMLQKNSTCGLMVLSLIFPDYHINLGKTAIEFTKEGVEEIFKIDNSNFEDFKEILDIMFCLKDKEENKINPKGDMAKRIAEKLKKRHQKLAATKNETKIALYSRYVSVLAMAAQKDINSLMNYTVFQLIDEFRRYELKVGYDVYFQAKLAGAQDLQEPEDWMQDIHPEIQ